MIYSYVTTNLSDWTLQNSPSRRSRYLETCILTHLSCYPGKRQAKGGFITRLIDIHVKAIQTSRDGQ